MGGELNSQWMEREQARRRALQTRIFVDGADEQIFNGEHSMGRGNSKGDHMHGKLDTLYRRLHGLYCSDDAGMGK